MKSLLRKIITNSIAFYVSSLVIGGLSIQGGWITILIGAAAFTLMSFLLKPVLQIVTLPLNLMTFGLFSFLIDAIMLYILTVLVPQITITGFVFPGIHFIGFVIPSVAMGTVVAFIVSSFVIAFIASAMRWLME